jgi:hypothetical protein
MQTDAMKRLRELEKENARLKRIVAEQAVDISILKEVGQEASRRCARVQEAQSLRASGV